MGGNVANSKVSEISFASLFSGCGGFDLGLVQAGLRAAAAFDKDEVALETHQANLGTECHLVDLSYAVHSDGVAELDLLSHVDVLLATPPCQGFSTAGKRLPEDPRNHFLPLSARIAVRFRPPVFLLENVPAARSGKHKKHWDETLKILGKAGYAHHEFCWKMTNVGLAQARTRLFLIALRPNLDLQLDTPDRTPGLLKEVLQNLEGTTNHQPRWPAPDSIVAGIAPHIKPDQKLSNVRRSKRSVHTWDIPEVFGRTSASEREVLLSLLRERRRNRRRDWGDADPVPTARLVSQLDSSCVSVLRDLRDKGFVHQPEADHWDLKRTFNGKYWRLSWDKPSPTVHTKFGDPHYFLHPSEDRGFTVREAARIQGFPDSFQFTGSSRDQYRQVGNAVPPPAARWIGEAIKKACAR